MTVALRVAVATALVTSVVFALVYAELVQQSDNALRSNIDTDLAGLVDIYDAQGAAGLVGRLQDRLALTPSREEQPWYLMQDANGRTLAGNVAVWPPLNPQISEIGHATAATNIRILARATVLRGGARLLVGRSTAAADAAVGQVRWLFIGGLAGIVACAFAIGLFAAWRLRARVDQINGMFNSLQHSDGTARAIVGTHGDEIDQLSRHMNDVLARVEHLLAAQREISDNIAHETRTPLVGLNQSLEVALQQTDDPVVIAALETARQQVNSLLQLLDALLDIASAEALCGDLRALGEIDLSEVAGSLAELYRPSAEEAGLALICDIDDGITMRGDAMQMSRLLVNLLDNGVKYAAGGGTTLRLSVKAGPVIVFEDDGPGIAAADQSLIFDRYHRGESQVGKGHGLGLALVAAIAARHKLTVRVEDAGPPNNKQGARFIVA